VTFELAKKGDEEKREQSKEKEERERTE